MISGRCALLQACFYLEHRARLSILKAAIDYVCLKEAGLLRPRPPAEEIDYEQLLFEILPASFHAGLNQLKTEPYFRRYALFWQVFLWGFGGFYLRDRKGVEFEWLAEQTGVPVEEIPRALRAFDILFPTADSWVTEAGPSQCTIVKMVPLAFRGLGAYHRLRRYKLKQYKDFNYKDYTINDLVKWNNAAVALLTS